MTIKEISEKFKYYTLVMSDGTEYLVNGEQKRNIIKSPINFITMPNGSSINKAFITQFKLNMGATREAVNKNKDALVKI